MPDPFIIVSYFHSATASRVRATQHSYKGWISLLEDCHPNVPVNSTHVTLNRNVLSLLCGHFFIPSLRLLSSYMISIPDQPDIGSCNLSLKICCSALNTVLLWSDESTVQRRYCQPQSDSHDCYYWNMLMLSIIITIIIKQAYHIVSC